MNQRITKALLTGFLAFLPAKQYHKREITLPVLRIPNEGVHRWRKMEEQVVKELQ